MNFGTAKVYSCPKPISSTLITRLQINVSSWIDDVTMTCIFILQYETTLRLGYTFAMSFIAMSSRLWRQLLKTDSPEMLVIVLLIQEACKHIYRINI